MIPPLSLSLSFSLSLFLSLSFSLSLPLSLSLSLVLDLIVNPIEDGCKNTFHHTSKFVLKCDIQRVTILERGRTNLRTFDDRNRERESESGHADDRLSLSHSHSYRVLRKFLSLFFSRFFSKEDAIRDLM